MIVKICESIRLSLCSNFYRSILCPYRSILCLYRPILCLYHPILCPYRPSQFSTFFIALFCVCIDLFCVRIALLNFPPFLSPCFVSESIYFVSISPYLCLYRPVLCPYRPSPFQTPILHLQIKKAWRIHFPMLLNYLFHPTEYHFTNEFACDVSSHFRMIVNGSYLH